MGAFPPKRAVATRTACAATSSRVLGSERRAQIESGKWLSQLVKSSVFDQIGKCYAQVRPYDRPPGPIVASAIDAAFSLGTLSHLPFPMRLDTSDGAPSIQHYYPQQNTPSGTREHLS